MIKNISLILLCVVAIFSMSACSIDIEKQGEFQSFVMPSIEFADNSEVVGLGCSYNGFFQIVKYDYKVDFATKKISGSPKNEYYFEAAFENLAELKDKKIVGTIIYYNIPYFITNESGILYAHNIVQVHDYYTLEELCRKIYDFSVYNGPKPTNNVGFLE